MKKILLIALFCLPMLAMAQTKIKETAVPQSVLLTLEKTYESYKVKAWYQTTGQYVAEIVVDGQNGRSYFAASGDWQYSSFPVDLGNCPTLMNTYFVNNYPGYRIKSIDYVEEMSGDNYYRMIIVRKGVGAEDCEMIFDTRGKLMKTNAPDPAIVKRDYYTHNDPDGTMEDNAPQASERKHKKTRPAPVVDEPVVEEFAPADKIIADFDKRVKASQRLEGPLWMQRGYDEVVGYMVNKQKVELEYVYDVQTSTLTKIGKVLSKDRYKSPIMKYLAEKYKGEKYKVEKMVEYTYDSKYRGEDGKKPKPYTYVVVSQKTKGSVNKLKFTRMEFDNSGAFIDLLAQPLDEHDVQ